MVRIHAQGGKNDMNQPPSWDPYGHEDPRQYQGRMTQHPGESAYQSPQYGPPQGQQPYPGPGYSQRSAQHRKRHWVRYAITGATVAVVGTIVAVTIASAENGSHTATTGQAAVGPTSSPPIAASPADLAKIGSVLVLKGHETGEKVTVTLVKVFRHPRPASPSDAPRPGYRLYAVQFRLDDTGSVAYSSSPSDGAVVVDSGGHSYQPLLFDVTGCRSFPGTENIAVGRSRTGCVVFEVPAVATITQVWLTLASGKGAQTGLWEIGS
jgi:hypothetical protein